MNGVFGKEIQKELVRHGSLALGGFKEAAQHAVVLQALGGASAVDDFAHDDERSQAALGLVIGRRHLGAAEAGEEMFLFRTQQALAKSLSFGVGLLMSIAGGHGARFQDNVFL